MVAALLGALLGSLIAFVLVLTSLPPWISAMEADAEALVLPGSEMVDLGSNTGATIIVGWDRWSTAEFEDDRNQVSVHTLLVARAEELGWSIDRTWVGEFARGFEASRSLDNVRISVGSQVEGGERIQASQGHITVSRNEERRNVLFWAGVGLGAFVGAWLALRGVRFARDPQAGAAE